MNVCVCPAGGVDWGEELGVDPGGPPGLHPLTVLVGSKQALVLFMLIRLTPKSARFGDDFVGSLAHWMLARLSPLHFGCCHEPVYSPSYVGATACPLIPSNDRNALNG